MCIPAISHNKNSPCEPSLRSYKIAKEFLKGLFKVSLPSRTPPIVWEFNTVQSQVMSDLLNRYIDRI